MDGGEVSYSSATGSLTADVAGGGLIGRNTGTIRQSFAEVAVFVTGSKGYAGGLVSYSSGTISNSYAFGAVTNESGPYTGGLVGRNHGGTVSNSYAVGAVAGSGTYEGGLIGDNTATVTNSFWNTETSGHTSSDGGEGKTTQEMQQLATFSSWDIEEDATIEQDYPFLAWTGDAAYTKIWVIGTKTHPPIG